MGKYLLYAMPLLDSYYSPTLWAKHAHLSTIIPSVRRQVTGVAYSRERVETPDGDFLDLDWCFAESRKLIVITHGLEGSSNRPYVMGMAKKFLLDSWNVLAWNCRSCSGEINRKGRFYHHGETEDLTFLLNRAMKSNDYDEIVLVGFSMGGSITIKMLSELTPELGEVVKCGFAASVPVDLTESVAEFRKWSMSFYRKKFLKRLEKKVRLKSELYPEQIKYTDFSRIKYFPDFDNIYTAPLHGFKDAYDFYDKVSAQNFLADVQVPLLLVNALNDPFLTPRCYPNDFARNSNLLFLETPRYGGHVGFMQRRNQFTYLEDRAMDFLNEYV